MAEREFFAAFLAASGEHPRPFEHRIPYGTAGFRTLGKILDSVLFRTGLTASLRSRSLHGETIGLMITASHNPEEDNGVKIVDPMGEMLAFAWEKAADRIANAPNDREQLLEAVLSVVEEHNIDLSQPANVVVGYDTRESSVPLALSALHGAEAGGAKCKNLGLLTTPQLHYIVRCINSNGAFGVPTEQGYYEKLAKAFMTLTEGLQLSDLVYDAANGIGGPKMVALKEHIPSLQGLKVVNDGQSGRLNHKCGADFVKVNQGFPEGVEVKPNGRYASVDGDADRLICFYTNAEGKFFMLDGDKISTLFAAYLAEQVSLSKLDVSLGVVQTAYANGSSTAYIKNTLKVPVKFAKTGVKYLHPLAETFDIGVYFEANGHGTILFSKRALELIHSQDVNGTEPHHQAARRLQALTHLINQAVGDAISDLLLVEVILANQGWSMQQWDACYTDLPNRLMKVKVKDRSIFQSNEDETRLLRPDDLQAKLDAIVAKFPQGRSFVRPSGTEDVVRVYAEAKTKEMTDELAHQVSLLVYDQAGGIGERPSNPSAH